MSTTYEMDALDCLLAYNYKVVDANGTRDAIIRIFRLCGDDAFMHTVEDKEAIAGWLQELEGNLEYYTKRIVDEGRKTL